MTSAALIARLRESLATPPPLPAAGETPARHKYLLALGREDLSLARLAEAHWDAVAILAEAGRSPEPGALYGVWAAEIPGKALTLTPTESGFSLGGTKPFCSGAGLVDRALITVTSPEQILLDVALHNRGIAFDESSWHTAAFAETQTATATFDGLTVTAADFVGAPGFYLSRPGFWHGACGPASCWAGGAIGLVDWALQQKRDDPHTRAHLGAMTASAWALESLLNAAGREIDASPLNVRAAHIRALTVRHLVEQHATDILRRFARAYGPHPLAFDSEASRRYQELDLYLRQSHAERDLEALAAAIRASK